MPRSVLPTSPARRRRPHRALRAFGAVVAAAALTATAAPAADAAGWTPRTIGVKTVTNGTFLTLGDSYSSGEGIGAYRDGTDTSTNRCHRSAFAYGVGLAALYRQRHVLAACSGARTTDFYIENTMNAGEPPQLARVDQSVRRVTMTIGGNDAGFSQLLAACVRPRFQSAASCTTTSASGFEVARKQIAALTGATTPVYPLQPVPGILADITGNAKRAAVYVGGYPQLFGTDAANYTGAPAINGQGSCRLAATGNEATDVVIGYADAQQLNALTRELNQALADSVAKFNATKPKVKAVFVPATQFTGHALCESEGAPSWIHPLLLTLDSNGQPVARPESFHPNVYGNVVYGAAFWSAMRPGRPVPAALTAGVDRDDLRRSGVLSVLR